MLRPPPMNQVSGISYAMALKIRAESAEELVHKVEV
jgi:hypothetical protein